MEVEEENCLGTELLCHLEVILGSLDSMPGASAVIGKRHKGGLRKRVTRNIQILMITPSTCFESGL